MPQEKCEDDRASEYHASYHEEHASQDAVGPLRSAKKDVEHDKGGCGDHAFPYPMMTGELYQKSFERR